MPDIQDRGESYDFPGGPDDDQQAPMRERDHRVGSEPGALSSRVSSVYSFSG